MRGITNDTDSSERGAVVVFVVIAIVVLLASAALAIDIGVGWNARRNLVTSTDAAALAAGGEYASGGVGCNAVAQTYLGYNAPTATMTACTPAFVGSSGYVTVKAAEDVDAYFGRVLGRTALTASSSTTVQWGNPASATGLRPFGLCSESLEMIAFLANPDAIQTHKISYTKANASDCNDNGAVPGNWGTINFDGGPGGANETGDWVDNGYDDAVFSGTLGGTCTNEAYACYPPSTGADAGVIAKVKALQKLGIFFGLPLYDTVSGNGSNAEFHFIGFARVKIVDFKLNGAEAQRFIELQFEPGLLTGSCCNPGGPATNAYVIAICAVDKTDLNDC